MHDIAVGGNEFPRRHIDEVTPAQLLGAHAGLCLDVIRPGQPSGMHGLLHAPQRGGLRLASSFGQRLGEVGEEHREP